MKIKSVVLMSMILLLLLPSVALANAPYVTFTFSHSGEPIWTQSAYLPAGVIDGYNIIEIDSETGEAKNVPLSRPEDIFIDSNDDVYVADTGNSRIVVFDTWGNYIRSFGEDVLSKPTGVFVDDQGTVYVADYNEEKVFLFAQDGSLLEAFGKPKSHLFGKNNPFKPLKVIADKRKNIFVVGEGTVHGLIQISQKGEFLGYFGGNTSGFSLKRLLQRTFFTQAQLDKLMKQLPPSATNVALDAEGLVYTATVGTRNNAIKRLNVAGKNLLSDMWSYSEVADITIDKLGNIYAVDAFRGRIIEYDRDGNILFIFGGTDVGNQRLGLFKTPSGIAVSSDGRIFVSDRQRSNLQILKPTEFTMVVHEAISYYMDGKYAQSEGPWLDVLRLNSMFDLAHSGLGMASIKQGDYEQADRKSVV